MALSDQIPPPAGLRKIREDLGLSQSELALALGFARNGERTIRQWESDPTFKPTGLAWAAMKYLRCTIMLLRESGDADFGEIETMLPECLR